MRRPGRSGSARRGFRPGPCACPPTGRPSRPSGIRRGGVVGADAAAAIPARLLGAGQGERVLDLCAAPGGKTMQLASRGAGGDGARPLGAPPGAVAGEPRPPRPHRRHRGGRRHGLRGRALRRRAPRRPVLRHRHDPPSPRRGLDQGGGRHRPPRGASGPAPRPGRRPRAAGGRLVYCTCSLEPEEGEAQVAAFLAKDPRFAGCRSGRRRSAAGPSSSMARATCAPCRPRPRRLLRHPPDAGRVRGFQRAEPFGGCRAAPCEDPGACPWIPPKDKSSGILDYSAAAGRSASGRSPRGRSSRSARKVRASSRHTGRPPGRPSGRLRRAGPVGAAQQAFHIGPAGAPRRAEDEGAEHRHDQRAAQRAKEVHRRRGDAELVPGDGVLDGDGRERQDGAQADRQEGQRRLHQPEGRARPYTARVRQAARLAPIMTSGTRL